MHNICRYRRREGGNLCVPAYNQPMVGKRKFPASNNCALCSEENAEGAFVYDPGPELPFHGTLPSLAFGFKSCSLKWKVVPQNKWTENWLPARDCWRAGGKVLKIIGYDTSPKDMKRYAHAKGVEDPKYQYWYPLVEWNMDRDACKRSIQRAGLPVPPKSACKFCPATQPEELHLHRKQYLRFIVIMEALAKPKLQGYMTADQLKEDYQNRLARWRERMDSAAPAKREKLQAKMPRRKKVGSGCSGLWRKATKKRPATMTEYIVTERLLPFDEVQSLRLHAATKIQYMQQLTVQNLDILNWHDFLEMFSAEDALHEECTACSISR